MSTAEPALREGCRAECYRLLSACFYPPERDALLADGVCVTLARTLGAVYPDAGGAPHAEAMHRELTALGATELRVDHAALFVGPFALGAAPYGSVYLDPDRRLMGETTLAASRCYADAGLELTLREPPDHVAVELEFMHFLASRSARAAADGDQETFVTLAGGQRRFLREHLGAWVPAFAAAIRAGAETPFYRALADCLEAFVAADLRASTEPPAPAR